MTRPNSSEIDLIEVLQSNTLNKRFSDVEMRLRDEQKSMEARQETTNQRIDSRLDRIESRLDRIDTKVDNIHKWIIRLLITIILAIFGVLSSTLLPAIISLFQS